ncbi:MAG: extracellular solute-binding protein [Ruminococcus sp.]|nr:extracellular solute-binding protein [Ruminococcus sp.]
MICSDDDYGSVYVTDTDFTDYTKVEADIGIDENAINTVNYAAAEDGTVYAFITATTHGDVGEPDWDDPDFDSDSFDFDAYYAAAESTYRLCRFDLDGDVISDNPVEAFEQYENPYLQDLFCVDEDTLFVSAYGDDYIYLTINSDGTVGNEFDFSEVSWVDSFGSDKDGNAVCVAYDSNYDMTYFEIDMENCSLIDNDIKLGESSGYTSGTIIGGSGDYTVYVPMTNGLYGLKEDNTFEEVINWVDSDINGEMVVSILGLDNGDFAVYERDWSVSSELVARFSLLTKRDSEELAKIVVVTLGVCWSDTAITNMVTDFNKSNDEYRIKIKDYSEYDVYDEELGEYTSTAEDQLKSDILSGNAPDMVCLASDNTMLETLSDKGTFVDLYTMLENDSEISKDDFLPNVLTAFESNDKLYYLSPGFTVTTLAGKAKFLSSDMGNWTIDDMIDTYNNLPEDMDLFQYMNSSTDIYSSLVQEMLGFYVDYENKTCSFDSDEFIKLLEFCGSFPEAEEIDYGSMSDEEIDQYFEDQEMALINDSALFGSIYMYRFYNYAEAVYAQFGEDITLVGYPSSEGCGGEITTSLNLSILSDSPNKDAAWSFIKAFFTEEYQEKYSNDYNGFPIIKEAFDKAADESMSKQYYIDDNGEKVEYDSTYWIGNTEVAIEPLTQEERDYIYDYITSITRKSATFDSDIYNICMEEAEAYFAGESTAEETANMIQNCVSIFISEQS